MSVSLMKFNYKWSEPDIFGDVELYVNGDYWGYVCESLSGEFRSVVLDRTYLVDGCHDLIAIRDDIGKARVALATNAYYRMEQDYKKRLKSLVNA